MTKDLKTIDLNSLPIESVTVQLRELFDDCEQTLRVVESIQPDDWRRVQNFGKMLARARQLTPHGEWADYITDTFAGRLTMRVAQRIVAAELNPDAEEKRKEKDRKRKAAKSNTTESAIPSHLKTANVVVSTPAEQSYPHCITCGGHHGGEFCQREQDPDPAPNPPTQRKTAKGSEKVGEDKKPPTQTVVPELLPDEPSSDPWEYMTFGDIIAVAVSKLADETQQKKAAKELRKLADKLDPPDETKPGKVPTASALRAEVDPDTMSEEMMLAVHDWVNHKQNNPDKAYKYKSVESWKRDLRRVLQVANQSGEQFLIEAIDKAISKGWRNWEQEHQNGKANGNGRQTGHDAGGQISSVEKQRRSVERIASRLGFKAE